MEELVSSHDSWSRRKALVEPSFSILHVLGGTVLLFTQVKGHGVGVELQLSSEGSVPRANCPAKRLSGDEGPPDAEAERGRKQHCPCPERRYQEAPSRQDKKSEPHRPVASVVWSPRTRRTRKNSSEQDRGRHRPRHLAPHQGSPGVAGAWHSDLRAGQTGLQS